MIKFLKKLFTKKLETSTLSEPASMSDRCDGCENIASCCQKHGKFQRNDESDGRV